MTLKNFICGVTAAAAVMCAAAGCETQQTRTTAQPATPFEMPEVALPQIPARTVSIVDFGAAGDGTTLNTQAFADAIEALAAKGGGRVEVPAGVWYTGPIIFKDNIELHLDDNALIVFSDDKTLYPLHRIVFEGLDTWRCVSPLTAMHVKNVAITGGGIIDGNGDAWRAVKREKLTEGQWKKKLAQGGIVSDDKKMWFPSESYRFGATTGADQNVSTWATTREDFERMHDFLRPVLVAFHYCENVLLEGVTFQNSPCWHIHPAMCTNLTVKDITVRCPDYAQNGDGIDVESCKNVRVTGSRFDVGDDGICIKSGKDKAGRERGIPCENIVVDNCVVFHGHGGFVVGSEMSGGVRNVLVKDCIFAGTDVGLRFKSTRGRGGVVENIWIEGIEMFNIQTEPLLFDLFYGGKSASEVLEDGDEAEVTDMIALAVDETTPAFRDIHISNIDCRGARRAMFFNGLPEMNVERVTVENARISAQTGAQINESSDVVLRNVRVEAAEGPALMLNNVKHLRTESFVCPPSECTLLVTGSRNEDIEVRGGEMSTERTRLSKNSEGRVTVVTE